MAGTSSLERALVLLRVIEQTPGGLTNAEISLRLDIPKTTCSYIARKLEHEGYLIKDAASGRYKIGLAVVALAHGALREVGIRTVAEPALFKLTARTGLSGGIGVLERGHVLLVDRVESPRFVDKRLRDDTKLVWQSLPWRTARCGKSGFARSPSPPCLN